MHASACDPTLLTGTPPRYLFGLVHRYDVSILLFALTLDFFCNTVSAFGHSSHATSSDNPESLVNQFYELAQKGSKPDSSLVSSLNSSLEKKGSSFGPQEIANLLWSVAKTGTKLDPKILATLVGLVSAKAGSFKPAQISAVLWALGTLGQKVDAGKLLDCTMTVPSACCFCVSYDSLG